jgi:hypothetical protein
MERQPSMKTIRAFTWGYWGWGSESRHFVRAVDRLEKKRRFLPPVFVDLRIARGGRAVDFKGNAFRDIVGSRRYVWMPKLGNKKIKTKQGKRLQIAEPASASDLLDRIVQLHKERRRVVMFCACGQPLFGGRLNCHRVAVADLLAKEAKKRRLSLEVSEWPGAEPVSLRVRATRSQESAILKGLCHIPLGPATGRIPAMAVLGWGSAIRFETSNVYGTIITGPADVQGSQWQLGAFEVATDLGRTATETLAKDFVRKAGFGAHSIRD